MNKRVEFRNLTKVIIETLLITNGLIDESLSFKFICFGVDDVNVFQGARIKVM